MTWPPGFQKLTRHVVRSSATPQFVDVIGVLQFLDMIAIRHAAGDEIVVHVPQDPLVVAVSQIEQPCLHLRLRLQVDLVHNIKDIYH